MLLTKPFRTKRKDLKFTFLGQEWEIIYEKRLISAVMGRENVAGQKKWAERQEECRVEMRRTPALETSSSQEARDEAPCWSRGNGRAAFRRKDVTGGPNERRVVTLDA